MALPPRSSGRQCEVWFSSFCFIWNFEANHNSFSSSSTSTCDCSVSLRRLLPQRILAGVPGSLVFLRGEQDDGPAQTRCRLTCYHHTNTTQSPCDQHYTLYAGYAHGRSVEWFNNPEFRAEIRRNMTHLPMVDVLVCAYPGVQCLPFAFLARAVVVRFHHRFLHHVWNDDQRKWARTLQVPARSAPHVVFARPSFHTRYHMHLFTHLLSGRTWLAAATCSWRHRMHTTGCSRIASPASTPCRGPRSGVLLLE